MSDPVALSRARLAEADRRMIAAGVAEAARYYQQNTFLLGVLEDDRLGLWSPGGAEEVTETALAMPRLAPAAAPVQANAPRESRASMWSKAVTEANAEAFAQGNPAPPPDQQAGASAETNKSEAKPAGAVAKSRAAWASAVDAANADLLRRGGRIGEG